MTIKPPPQPLIPAFEGDDADWAQTPPWAREATLPYYHEPETQQDD